MLSLLKYAPDEPISCGELRKLVVPYLKLYATLGVPKSCTYFALLSLAENSVTDAILEFAEAAECAFRRVLR